MDKKEINIFTGIIIFCIIFLVILLFFIVTYIKQSKLFNKEKLKAEIKGSELERKKISSDLHDDLGPILASVKIYVNALSKNNSTDILLIEKITKNLDLCLQQVREMANNLMPNTLQRNGLQKAVLEFITNIEDVVPFEIHLTFPKMELSLNAEEELNVYRIIQEIVTNTINHSNCTILEIIFEKLDSVTLKINTFDNGKGFDFNKYKENKSGCGIANITNRVSLLNGKLTLFSTINEGTKYNISIPLNKINTYE